MKKLEGYKSRYEVESILHKLHPQQHKGALLSAKAFIPEYPTTVERIKSGASNESSPDTLVSEVDMKAKGSSQLSGPSGHYATIRMNRPQTSQNATGNRSQLTG